MKKFLTFYLITISTFAFSQTAPETHLKNIRQMTHGGDNAEAYFSFNNKFLSFQSNNKAWGNNCDQIYNLEIKKALKDTSYKPQRISNGEGRTTCSFFMPGDKHILFASTFQSGKECPAAPEYKKDGKYLWPIYSSFDIYVADLKGNITKKLTDTAGYDAEATISPDGKTIVFTSTRSGDLELWTMDVDGKNLHQVTHDLGYDGGAFFSPDSKKLVFRASRPKTEDEIKEYKGYLAQDLVAPLNMEIYTCNVDGSDIKQVTHLGKANWAPYYTPDGTRIIFSSNHHSTRGFDFNLYTIKLDGTGLEQISTVGNFNAFPMFSRDGKKLVWSSNRNSQGKRGIDLFIADWTN